MRVDFTVWSIISSGETVYSTDDPVIKTVDGVKFIEVTNDISFLKTKVQPKINFMRLDTLKKAREINVTIDAITR
jgi:hypothetical protein